ncbi:MAG: patatin family protein [Coriobacteriaceae bacterium]|nr:patatin family protein [Coriobacteriaceae bacterium]
MPEKLTSNVFDTALFFEGGSMRGCYSAAVVTRLLEEGIYFDKVYGISAGSSHTVNYLSRDPERSRTSFTSFIMDPRFSGLKYFLTWKGWYNSHFIYEEAAHPDGPIPFDFETFQENPADCCIISVDQPTGEGVFFTKDGIETLDDLMIRCRASSTLPFLMNPTYIGDHICFDGAYAEGGGLPMRSIEADGYEKVFVVRTRQRGYRKPKQSPWIDRFFWRRPEIREVVSTRNERYNESCDLLEEWEKEGKAYVFYCDDLSISGFERDLDKLNENYDAGYAQSLREADAWHKFLGV